MDQIATRPKPAAPPPIEQALGLSPDGSARKRRRVWPYLATLVVLAGLAGGYYLWTAPGSAQTVYQAVPVERGNITVEVAATGTLEPLTQVDISSELSGIVRSVMVEENQTVARGDVLAELDKTRLAAQVEKAEASVEAARARVGEAEVTLRETGQALDRADQLFKRGMVSDQAQETARAARDRAQSAVDSAKANLAIAEADLKLQQADLANMVIYAPIDGIVLLRDVDPGQTVASSLQAPVLFTIAEDLGRMQLKAAIDEADIGMVKKGQKARFTVDAFPAQRFNAEISDISYASTATEGVVTYEARLAVNNADLVLRPGMTATVSIVTREANDVLVVPTGALRFTPESAEGGRTRGFSFMSIFNPRMRGGRRGGRPDGGQSAATPGRTVYVLENGQPVARRVETGATDGDRVEILSGLSEGDEVVVSAVQRPR